MMYQILGGIGRHIPGDTVASAAHADADIAGAPDATTTGKQEQQEHSTNATAPLS